MLNQRAAGTFLSNINEKESFLNQDIAVSTYKNTCIINSDHSFSEQLESSAVSERKEDLLAVEEIAGHNPEPGAPQVHGQQFGMIPCTYNSSDALSSSQMCLV